MRRILLLCLISPLAWAEKDPLIDFDSPFNKTAILLDALGKTETREVLEAQKKDNLLELRKADGTLVVVPEDKVVAILPKLPSPGLKYTQAQAAQALIFLQKAQSKISNREEVSPAVMLTWQKLSKEESNYESEAKKATTSMIQNWFSKVTLEGDEEKDIPLEEYIQEGEAFLAQAGKDRPAMEARLEKARQRVAMDLAKVDRVRLIPEWENIGLWLPLGLVGVLALICVWGLLNLSNFLTALKMTLMSFLSAERASRVIVMNTKSMFGIIVGPLLLYVVFLATRVEKSSPPIPETALSVVEKRVLYLSLNSHFNWSKQGAQKIEVPASRILGYLFAKIEQGELSTAYLQYGRPLFQEHPEGISLVQNLKVLWVPLQLRFIWQTGEGMFSFANAKTEGFWIGKIPLGSYLGDYAAENIFAAFKEWDPQLGIDSKAQWQWKGKNQWVISLPDVNAKSVEILASRKGASKEVVFKKRLTATELADAFADGAGGLYLGRYVDLSGPVAEVVSAHRLGNSKVSEVLRNRLASQDNPSALAKLASKGIEDDPDVFFLSTQDEQGSSKIKVKCLVKAPETFYLDAHGDLYREGQNPRSDAPLVRKGMEASFRNARVESFERGVIELYDAKLVEGELSPRVQSETEARPNLPNHSSMPDKL